MTELTNVSKNESLDLAYEALDSCNQYIDHIIKRVYELTIHYQANQVEEANNALIEVSEVMDLYIQLLVKSFKILRLNNQDSVLKNESVQKLEIHLLSIVKALFQAKEKNDIIMLCDLLEYELVDNLNQWKTKVLPELKKSRN